MVGRTFICHASEDKASFVSAFATALRDLGVRVWYDDWDIQLGDSLVQRVFEEGLTRSDAVVVIVSAAALAKPWVREELDVAVIKRITERACLIPVVLDDAPMPTALVATRWLRANPGDPHGAAAAVAHALAVRRNEVEHEFRQGEP